MHFAIEMAGQGNKVFFIDPPRASEHKEPVSVITADGYPSIKVIRLQPLPFALFLRHKVPFIYNSLVKRYIRKIKKITGSSIDELWNFNPHVFVNMKAFAAKKNILLLYDFYKGDHIFRSAATADIMVSPSQLILDHYRSCNVPQLLLQHGLNKIMALAAEQRLQNNEMQVQQNKTLKVGYTGNLLRAAIDTGTAEKIIAAHPTIEFHFWGPYSVADNNVTDKTAAIPVPLQNFISFLQKSPNVFLHGIKQQQELAEEIFKMDAFLFLYTAASDMNAASNSHKLLEYLGTGKVVVGNYVSNYAGTQLLEMSKEQEDFPGLFNEVIENLDHFNSTAKQQERIRFALDNTYARQVERVQKFMYS